LGKEGFESSMIRPKSEWEIRSRARVRASGLASSSSSNTSMSAGTDFIPTEDFMPRKKMLAFPMRFRPTVSVSVIIRPRNGLSSRRGRTRDREKSRTSVRVGK
jgi:hypothetical protein